MSGMNFQTRSRDEVILFCTIAQKMAGSDSHNSLWGICVFWTDTGKAYVYYCIWIDSGVDFFHGRHRLEKENRKNTVAAVCNFLYGKFL